MIRISSIAFVIIRLDVGGRPFTLLRANSKWQDWSFVGGHVETGEESDWSHTAIRETEEEMYPLRNREHFTIVPVSAEPLVWIASSKSAGGATTEYRVQCFSLRFTRDPRCFLRDLHPAEFILVNDELLSTDDQLGLVVPRVVTYLGESLAELPLSWNETLRIEDIPFDMLDTELSSQPNPQVLEAGLPRRRLISH